MGDFEARVPNENGELVELTTSPWPVEPSNPHQSEISSESWHLSEQTTREIIGKIQPTRASLERRKNVVEYVQKVISRSLLYEVFSYGSVPLKTYLPDGDVDLTVIVPPNSEDTLATFVHTVLEREENNKAAEFEVKDVQIIHAEVKLIKCLVQNIVVDISFNQIGGLSTLFFLDQVDSIIGKGHLFKHTIILIKAWCYYESRILGAHHSLISTYALETLVLYIFHLYHSSLDGPLVVLYRFLDYFSKFDWDNFGVSLNGPVRVSSLPEIVVEVPEIDEGDLLLSTEFLNRCVDICAATPRIWDSNHRLFVKKHLNIIDPLKENNNLGRSVSKGNLYRIRSAFSYGARKLGKILQMPRESMSNELKKFFKNTIKSGNVKRPDVQTKSGSPDANMLPVINTEKGVRNGITFSSSFHDSFLERHVHLNESKTSAKENGKEMEGGVFLSNPVMERNHLQSLVAEESYLKDEINISEARTPNKSHNAPLLLEKGKILKEESTTVVQAHTNCVDFSPDYDEFKSSTKRSQLHSSNHRLSASTIDSGPAISNGAVESSSACYLVGGGGILDYGFSMVNISAEDTSPEANALADLSGNHEEHLKNLQHAQSSYDFFLNGYVSPGNPSSSFHYATHPMIPYGFIPGLPFSHLQNSYSMNPGFIPGGFGLKEMRNGGGTCPFIPNMNQRTYRDKSSLGRGKNLSPGSQMPRSRNNGRAMTAPESNLTDTRCLPVSSGNGRWKSGQLKFSQPSSTIPNGFSQSNGNLLENEPDFGSLSPVPLCTTPEPAKNLESDGTLTHNNGSPLSTAVVQKPGMGLNHGRLTELYHLKDEYEFPPLSGRGNQNASSHSNGQKAAWEAKK